MEIILSEKQKSLLQSAFQEQQQLQQQAQAEYNKIQKRIDDAVVLILDAKGVEAVPGIQFADGKLILPEEKAEVHSENPKEEEQKQAE